MTEKSKIQTDYITLGQFLKLANVFESGGMIKQYLKDQGVIVNGVLDHRRGRKLYPNDQVRIDGIGTFLVVKD